MATQLEKQQRQSASQTAARIDSYVHKQLSKTTTQVRVSDVATGALTLATFVISFFLLMAIVDAWIWPLTITARFIALGMLLIGTAVIFWYNLLPYFFKKINPQYAAKMIEEAKPDFKNSLLNYLSLKKSSSGKPVHRAILGEVSKKAATDLSTISPDAAVDKSNLIRIGFMLVAMVAGLIGYSIFSPKNPWPTFQRILAPAAKISQPSAVTIDVITPRDAEVFFGDKPEIIAKVNGVTEQDEVRVVYSSLDGQLVDAILPMSYTGQDNTYSIPLATSSAGIQQSISYRVEAGDGISPQYRLNVRPNPSITVNSIHITPPKYTGLPEQTIEGQGEIQAVEGSQVEITATANLPIKLAYIVPLHAKSLDAENTQYRELRTIEMISKGLQAAGRMTVGLNSNRDRALFSHYKINFRSEDDFKNEQPNIYPIRVIADLAPEIEIVSPSTAETTVPANQRLPIEIWASDLDYELSAIDMFIDHDGRRALEKRLFKAGNTRSAGERVQVRSSITPAAIGLKPGDRAILYAVAADNRISSSSDLADPNTTRSDNYTLIITAPVETPDEPDDQQQDENGNSDNPNKQSEPENSDSQSADAEQTGEQDNSDGNDQPQDNEGGNEGSGEKSPESGANDSDSDNTGDSGSASDSTDPSQGDPSSDSSSDGASSDSQNKGQDDSQNDEQGDSPANSQSGSDSNADQQTKDGSEGNLTDAPNQDPSDGSSDGAGGSDQGSTDQRGQQGSSNKENSGGDADGQEFRDESLRDGQQQPLDENTHDGERFERLKEYFDDKQKQQSGGGDSQQPENSDGNQQRPESRGDNDQSDNRQPTEAPEQSRGTPKTDSAADNGNATDAGDQDSPPDNDSNSKGGAEPNEQQPSPTDSNDGNQGSDRQNPSNGQDQQPSQPASESRDGSDQQSPSSQQPDQQSQRQDGSDSGASKPGDENKSDSKGSSGGNDPKQQQERGGDPSKSESASSSDSPGSERADGGDSQQPKSGQNGTPSNSDQAPSSSADQSDSNSKNQPSQQPSEQSSSNNSTSPNKNQDQQSGATGQQQSARPEDPTGVPQEEQANLDYTKRVTDLVLDQLEDQKYDPDPELLEQMNWSQQELDQFLKQWQQMKAKAEAGNPTAQNEYTERLRELGITPKTRSRRAKVQKDKEFRLSEDGAIDQIPRQYLEKYNSFIKRRNRSLRK